MTTTRQRYATAQGLHWMDRAACFGQTDLFFGPDHERGPERAVREADAKDVCGQCPVRGDCLTYAIWAGMRSGVWGGMNEEERALELRRQRKARGRAA